MNFQSNRRIITTVVVIFLSIILIGFGQINHNKTLLLIGVAILSFSGMFGFLGHLMRDMKTPERGLGYLLMILATLFGLFATGSFKGNIFVSVGFAGMGLALVLLALPHLTRKSES